MAQEINARLKTATCLTVRHRKISRICENKQSKGEHNLILQNNAIFTIMQSLTP